MVWQKAKHDHHHPVGLLQPLPVPSGAWQALTMDFIEGLPSSKSYNSILVAVNRYTKYAHFIALKHPFTSQTVARVVLDKVIKLHEFPHTIVSNRDHIFTSAFWNELFALFGIGYFGALRTTLKWAVNLSRWITAWRCICAALSTTCPNSGSTGRH